MDTFNYFTEEFNLPLTRYIELINRNHSDLLSITNINITTDTVRNDLNKYYTHIDKSIIEWKKTKKLVVDDPWCTSGITILGYYSLPCFDLNKLSDNIVDNLMFIYNDYLSLHKKSALFLPVCIGMFIKIFETIKDNNVNNIFSFRMAIIYRKLYFAIKRNSNLQILFMIVFYFLHWYHKNNNSILKSNSYLRMCEHIGKLDKKSWSKLYYCFKISEHDDVESKNIKIWKNILNILNNILNVKANDLTRQFYNYLLSYNNMPDYS